MRVLIVTPLYPPEVADAAAYAKELARRLSHGHEITVVAYAHLPETLPNVAFVAIEKGQPLFMRLFGYLRALVRATPHTDIIYAVNGVSVELPLAIMATVTRTPILFCLADPAAHAQTKKRFLYRIIERIVRTQAAHVIIDLPPARPEILPLEPLPIDALATYENAWARHIEALNKLFIHVTH